jgi:hypothetical protein
MLAFDYVFIPHSIQCPFTIRSELRVSKTCLADNKTFGNSRVELSYLTLLAGLEPLCHLEWLTDGGLWHHLLTTPDGFIIGAICQSAIQISDADISETVMLPALRITGDANLRHDFVSL